MDAFQQFLYMGGYAAFVWPAYIITSMIMVGLYITTRRSLKTNRSLAAELRDQESEDS